MTLENPAWILPLLLTLALAVAACDKKSDDDGGENEAESTETHQVEPLGVSIETPGSWERSDRGSQVLFSAGMDGIVLELRDEKTLPDDIDAAASTFMMEPARVHAAETLPDGGFYWHTDVAFGEMVLPMVTVVKVGARGVVKCSYQLQPGDDPTPVATACKSMKPL